MDEHETVFWAERPGSLFEPDVILPVQFFRALRGKTGHDGERRLVIAVLDDAVNCFQKNLFARDRRGRRLFREAETWMMSRDRELPFSFENICEFLALDPDYVRSGIRRWTHIAESQGARRLEAETGAVRPPGPPPLPVSATRTVTAFAPNNLRGSVGRSLPANLAV